MKLHSICYVSTVSDYLDSNGMANLFNEIISKNNAIGITGLLLHSDGNFMQIMEGQKNLVVSLYESIKNDPRHHHMIEILSQPIEHRIYENYQTGFSIVNTEKAIFKLKLYVNWLEKNFEGVIKTQAEIIQPFIKYI